MDAILPPLDLTPEEWAAIPPRVRAIIQILLAAVAELLPEAATVVPVHPHCPNCHATLRPVCLPDRQHVWQLPISVGRVPHLQQVASAALAPAPTEVQQAVEQVLPTAMRRGGGRERSRRAEAVGPWQAAATALVWLAEEVPVIWAMFREGTLDRATMQGLIQAIQPALWARVEPGQFLKNILPERIR